MKWLTMINVKIKSLVERKFDSPMSLIRKIQGCNHSYLENRSEGPQLAAAQKNILETPSQPLKVGLRGTPVIPAMQRGVSRRMTV